MSTFRRREFLQQSALASIGLWAAGRKLIASPASEAAPTPPRIRMVTLEGTPQERGLAHGRALKGPIHELLKVWKADLTARYRMDADSFIQRFLRRTSYVPAIKQWTPELLEEVNGIARGADVDVDTVLVFQLVDEYWVNGPGIAGEHCSALAIGKRKDQPSVVAQNMDLEGFRNGFQVVLHIKEPAVKREAFILSHAGLIGLNGMNRHSVGVCCNTLSQLANCRDGLPVACVVRGMLQHASADAASDFLRRVKHASGQNYVIGDAGKVAAYECSAGKVSPLPPAPGEMILHTNHPLINDDYNSTYRDVLAKPRDAAKRSENSVARLASLQKRLGSEPAPPHPTLSPAVGGEGRVRGMERIKAALAARDSAEHPVCRPYRDRKDNFTFASTIMVLAEKPELHIAAGPPDTHTYQMLRFA